MPYVEAPEQIVPGIPRYYATTMPYGTSAYGLVVESHEGRPTKIEGNELHPASLGSSSARVQAAISISTTPIARRSSCKRGERVELGRFRRRLEGAGARLTRPTAARGSRSSRRPPPRRRSARLAGGVPEALPARALRDAGRRSRTRTPLAGVARAAGRPLLPVYRLDKAKAILALDADILHADPEMVRHTRGFAAGRRVAAPGDAMNRLWAVEAVLSITGANADHRLRLAARRIPAFVAALAAELGRQGLAIDAPAAPDGAGRRRRVAARPRPGPARRTAAPR